MTNSNSHSIVIGYILWIFGFMGAHRFYYGRPISGIIWLFTLGLFFIGWIVDLFLIPGMDKSADRRFLQGPINYNIAWVLLTFLGVFGIHRFYQRKWITVDHGRVVYAHRGPVWYWHHLRLVYLERSD